MRRSGVVTRQELVRAGLVEHARTRLARGDWCRPVGGVYVCTPGPLTDRQRVWVALLHAGSGAAAGGVSVLLLRGLTGWTAEHVHVCATRFVHPWAGARFHRLAEVPVHSTQPVPRVAVGMAAVQAASWERTDEAARTLLRMTLQQRLASPALVRRHAVGGCRRRPVILEVVEDVEAGATTRAEAAFVRAWRRRGLPPLQCQVPVTRADGSRWFFDVCCEPQVFPGLRCRVFLEIDGAHHLRLADRRSDDTKSLAAVVADAVVLRMTNDRVLDGVDACVDEVVVACRAWGWTG